MPGFRRKPPVKSSALRTAVVERTEKLHKMLAAVGLGSRRMMEQWISAKRVSVNGKPATIGARVSFDDVVRVDKRIVHLKTNESLPRILLYHKLEGEMVTRSDPENRATVFEKLPPVKGGKWVAIGRLDYNTSGLMIFTTSGELANRLMHPKFQVDREYAVRLKGQLSTEQIQQLRKGVGLEDGLARFTDIQESGGEGVNHWYYVVLQEGRKREVRRMFEATGLIVSRLMRVRFGIIDMPPRLRRGRWMELEEKQVKEIMQWAEIDIKLSAEPPAKNLARRRKVF